MLAPSSVEGPTAPGKPAASPFRHPSYPVILSFSVSTIASPDIGLSKPRAIRPAHVEERSSIRTSESHHLRDRFRTPDTWCRAVRTRCTHIADIAGLRRYSIDAQDPRKRSLCQQQSAKARRESTRGRTVSANAHVLCCATRTNQRAFLRGFGRRCRVAPASAAHLQPPMR